MSTTGLAAFDSTLHTTHIWLNEICEELGWERDPQRAYKALRGALHALRDRLHPGEAAGFAAQLPLLVRGIFYEGWHPADKPKKTHSLGEFLVPVAVECRSDGKTSPEAIARAVFAVVRRHMSVGEVADIITVLPTEIQRLWARAFRVSTAL
ncbi:MAG: DUF2267 domain-containing protein [Planctomycetia bacterium]|nr:DUF2267 domain-containing protein [Planctomycetia bacterium]